MLLALLAAAVIAAPPAPPALAVQPKAHAVILNDQDLETIRFMAVQIGSRCSATDEGFQFCRAALLARDLELNLDTQLRAEGKPKP
jgi:hypothetical protein